MTDARPCSLRNSRLLRRLCFLLCVLLGCCLFPVSRAQELDKPLQNIDEEITAFSFAPDGRIAYSVRRLFKTKQYDLQRDDIWIQEAGGKRRRLLQGEKFLRGTAPFSYAVDSFHWSPNGRLLLAQLFTTTVTEDAGRPEDSFATLVLEDNGKEIRVAGGDSLIKDSANASFLPDNSTIIYLAEAVKPRVLYSLKYVNVSGGSVKLSFEGRTFLDANRIPYSGAAIAVEQSHAQTGPPRLQHLDLQTQEDTELATLDGYVGGLAVSPSGKKAAYFIDREVLEVRDLAATDHVARLRIGIGVFQWAPDENRILLKRALEKKSGDIVWIDIPPLTVAQPGKEIPVTQPLPRPILHGLTFRDFAISPDGRFLAVVAPGKRNLLVFPLPR